MNIRKIKLALTAGLINQNTNGNALNAVKDLMTSFADEAGRFLGLNAISNSQIGNAVRERYTLNYEHCTLNVDLVWHPQFNRQTIQHFQLR
jgi:hypothetical protein